MASSEITLKKLREDAEAALEAGVANKAQLVEAVPALVALQERIVQTQKSINAAKKVVEALTKLCSDYAHDHPQFVFDQAFSVSPIGGESGDLEIGEITYHYSRGFDGYIRTEPGKLLTQDFLSGLPDGWAKKKLELDVTAVANANLSADALAEHGLKRKPRYKWTEL